MANDLKNESYYLFDSDENIMYEPPEENKPGLRNRLKAIFTSRFALLGLIFILTGAVILFKTAALQLNPGSVSGVSETSGVSRQQIVNAPRGDIYDASGVVLAHSETVPVLYLSYAGLAPTDLNSMLLDLSYLLENHGVEVKSELTDYFDLDHSGCSHQDGEGEDCGIPVFKKPDSEIAYWQSSPNLFGLKETDQTNNSNFRDEFIKASPEVFFDYLLYEKYAIENYDADGIRYSREDAWRIMKLRYLIMKDNWSFINGTPIEISRQINEEIVSVIYEQNYRFKGVLVGQDSRRVYTDQVRYLSHVVGYTGKISAAQYEELRGLGYAPDSNVGQAGVEYSAERYLAGQSGIKPYNIWSATGEEGAFFSESIGKDATAGYDVRLTIDLSLQKIAQQSLEKVIQQIRNSPDNKNKGDADAGAVVALDVKTGAVLAMASYPYYDPNDFLMQAVDEQAAEKVKQYLTDNEQKPMWNRAIMEIYAPGSTFKPATSVAALQSGTITPESSTIRCVGSEKIGDWPFRCLEYPSSGHGNLDLTRGLATSCNMYFYHLGVKTGIDNIDFWGKQLGLGEISGIDLPGEAKGFRSSRETKILLRSNPEDQIWFPADTCQTAIGQFDNSFTILQLARYTAAVATGNLVTPHVIQQITRDDGVIIKYNDPQPQPIGLDQSTLDAVKEGMLAVSTDREGTARRYFADYPIAVAAKTGTAETGREDVSSSNGLFICFAPADDPQIAIAQIIEKGAWGSNTIGIAVDILDEYFGFNQPEVSDILPDQPGLIGLSSDNSPVSADN